MLNSSSDEDEDQEDEEEEEKEMILCVRSKEPSASIFGGLSNKYSLRGKESKEDCYPDRIGLGIIIGHLIGTPIWFERSGLFETHSRG
ncbi:hypothetical protein M0802_015083 [Mischocyttarus mexicanus]|nr:hypothetical protein M0802_015083 [Mischocyttarus mexicanus]